MYRLFRGALPGLGVQSLKVLGLSLRDHAVLVVVPGEVNVMLNMTLDLVTVASLFHPTLLADHVFLIVVIAILKWDEACFGGFPNTFPGQMSQHWYSPQFTNPSVAPFAHPMSFY